MKEDPNRKPREDFNFKQHFRYLSVDAFGDEIRKMNRAKSTEPYIFSKTRIASNKEGEVALLDKEELEFMVAYSTKLYKNFKKRQSLMKTT